MIDVLLSLEDSTIIQKNNINFKSKSWKLQNYRKKHSKIRHEYYAMAGKYKSWDKKMLTFTVPSAIQGKTIKKGRYTKLRYLLELRAYLSKCFNNTDGIKYFMNIELGKAYSNPHLHIQLWIDPMTSSQAINLIFKKAIAKFDLKKDRCYITEPENDNAFYDYVIKDYSKDKTDKEIWDYETQKDRMKDQLGLDRIRWYSKSRDKYTQRVYKIFYKYFGVLRKYANEFIEKFIGMFFQRPQLKVLREWFSILSVYRIKRYDELFGNTELLIFDVLYACRDPP